jgi:DNA-binding Lrp family transcriptional regulator
MKDLQPNTMTIKQVADSFGVSSDTVRNKVKELFPDKMAERKKTVLNEYEVTALSVRMKQNENLSKKLSTAESNRQLPQTEIERQLIVAQAIQIMNESIHNLQLELQQSKAGEERLQIQLDKSKQYHSVKKVKNLGLLPDVSARKMWNPLKKWSIENDYKIISIFDANYGEVKTYHATAWKAVYGVEL